MTVTVHHGDSREVLKGFADASIDSVVCDPPYALVSVLQRFGNSPRSEATENTANPYGRTGRGFMGQRWDTGETAFDSEFWVEVLRVLKPGGHLIAFSGTRTYHRLGVAIEDAGFEIRDMIQWLYGSGFPKSHDVSKGIDKAAGASREVVGRDAAKAERQTGKRGTAALGDFAGNSGEITAPATPEAAAWEGWGTALKPACEPMVLARKPLAGTVAANVLAHGTGALNIDGCRIHGDDAKATAYTVKRTAPGATQNATGRTKQDGITYDGMTKDGRWPANVLHDGSAEVDDAFPDGVARFFYSPKADAADRCGSKHPTVKPIDLMAYLCRLVTPPGGVVLDPFAGSGSTGMACLREGFDCILIEREAQYVEDIHRRLKHVEGADTPLFANDAAPSLFGDVA